MSICQSMQLYIDSQQLVLLLWNRTTEAVGVRRVQEQIAKRPSVWGSPSALPMDSE